MDVSGTEGGGSLGGPAESGGGMASGGRSDGPGGGPEGAGARGRGVDTLARLLDRAFRVPGTDIHVGLDGLIGLIPGFGDAAGAALSGAIVLAAVRAGAPPAVLGRMVANVALDTALGAVPVVGDVFDFAWKANAKNAALLRRFMDDPAPTRKASAGVVALVVGGLVAILGLGLWAALEIVRALLGG